jgi:hypothetical protein
MFSKSLVASLAQLPQPLLTLYINVNPSDQTNRGPNPGFLTWLSAEAKTVAHGVPAKEQVLFQEQLKGLEHFLRGEALRSQSCIIFAGTGTWQQLPLQMSVNNELSWGRPQLSQLLALINEHKTCCVVAVDHAGARFFRYELGKMTELAGNEFRIDISQWKKREHAHMARPHTKMPHGPQVDAFKQRMEVQYSRLCREVAERIKRICKAEHPVPIVLAGSKRLTGQIEKALPANLRQDVALVTQNLARIELADLQQRLVPKIAAWISQHEKMRIDQLLDGDHRSVIGIDETLAQLQEGRIGTLVLSSSLEARLRQCVKCGLVSRSADPVCTTCGSKRRAITLREALPELMAAHQTGVEMVNGQAGKRLIEAGGIGGWLRQPKNARL